MSALINMQHRVGNAEKPSSGGENRIPPGSSVGSDHSAVEDGPGNLESVFVSTCPFVPVHTQHRTITPRRPGSDAYFRLDEFWQFFEEWSAYGAGVPVKLGTGQEVQQYYSPYLSGIQLFAAERSAPRKSNSGESSDGGDSDNESEGQSMSSASMSTDISTCGSDSEEELSSPDGRGSKGAKSVLHQCLQEPSRLLFEYFEKDAPHVRVPLTDKVEALATGEGGFPGLLGLTSADLHPASWVSIAWYPIYRVPAGRQVRDLGAAFLTYHSLSLAPGDGGGPPRGAPFDARPAAPRMSGGAEASLRAAARQAADRLPPQGDAGRGLVPLRPFAYHGYKAGGRLWSGGDRAKALAPMVAAAGAWVQRRGARHKDYEFFSRCPVTY